MRKPTFLPLLLQIVACAAILAGGRDVKASELDPSTGLLTSSDPNTIMIGFEDPAQLAKLGVALTKVQGSAGSSSTVFVDAGGTPMTAAELTAHLAPVPGVEGAQALLLGTGPADGASGILIPGSALASLVKKPQIQVTVWVRSTFATPALVATYGTGTLPTTGSFTSVTAIRTGRETSDGWAELTTGPIDTAIWGVPLAQLTVSLSSSRSTGGVLLLDALEIAPLDGAPVAASPCSIATEDTACGPDGECQFGHCLPAYASWGPTPTAAHRGDFVDRWIAIAQNIHGARNVAAHSIAMMAARPALTAAKVGGSKFFTGMIRLVNALRNHHTFFGEPANMGLLQPLAAGISSSSLGACAGIGELDLLADGGPSQLGFIVYKVAATSVVGATLHVGDAITKIDGIDPLTWVRSTYLTWATGVPADPGADLAWSATSVAWIISHRAQTVEITHCASSADCSGANRTVQTIDVAAPAWKNLQGTGLLGNENDPNVLDCPERFQDALTNIPPPGNSDVVTTQIIWTDTLGVQFDGTMADPAAWEKQVTPAFEATPAFTKVLFDVRQGNGGYGQNSELIAEEIRAMTQPIGMVDFPVACWDQSDTVGSLIDLLQAASPSCEEGTQTSTSSPCDLLTSDYFLGDWYSQMSAMETVTPFTPGGTGARVAWLQAADVSANDYLAALVQGRANQRVFGPGPTSGSYGTISSIAPLLLGWHGGSIQMTDSLWADTPTSLANQSFRSGVGVPPDEVVAQKMSDAMNNIDTMLAAARAWLEQ
jgi:hypothetical protein